MTNATSQQQQPSGAAFRIVGNVVRELDMRMRANSTEASFTLAVSNPGDDKEPSYFYVRCFDQLAREAAMMLVKGSRIEVTGSMETWQNRAERKSGVYFNVKKIKPLARCKPLPAPTAQPIAQSDLDDWITQYDTAAAEIARKEAQHAPRGEAR